MGQLRKTLFTLTTLVRFVTAVHPLVVCHGPPICETLWTFVTFVWLFACVNSRMLDEDAGVGESFAAYFAFIRFLAGMQSHVGV